MQKHFCLQKDTPTQFMAKLQRFQGTTNATVFRARNLLSGEASITDDLAKTYPLSIQKTLTNGDSKTLFIHEYVDAFMKVPQNIDAGATQRDALTQYALDAKNG